MSKIPEAARRLVAEASRPSVAPASAAAVPATTAAASAMDGCGGSGGAVTDEKDKAAMDAAASSVMRSTYAEQNTRVRAGGIVQAWLEVCRDTSMTEDEGGLSPGEGCFDRLEAMLALEADSDGDGELAGAEEAEFSSLANSAWDYMASRGVAAEDLEVMFNGADADASNTAADRALDVLAEAVPEGESEMSDDLDTWAFSDPGSVQSALDAVYSKKVVFRNGIKAVVKRRVSGTVKRTPAQMTAMKMAQRKAHSAAANVKRMKSMGARRRAGK